VNRADIPLTLSPEIVAGVVAWARGYPSIDRLWVIGSRAKGTASLTSDLDLALDLVSGVDNELAELIQIRQSKRALASAIGVEVKDIYLRSDRTAKTFGAAEEHGILLYKRGPQT
jgi:predicted nucleotidyltransferase